MPSRTILNETVSTNHNLPTLPQTIDIKIVRSGNHSTSFDRLVHSKQKSKSSFLRTPFRNTYQVGGRTTKHGFAYPHLACNHQKATKKRYSYPEKLTKKVSIYQHIGTVLKTTPLNQGVSVHSSSKPLKTHRFQSHTTPPVLLPIPRKATGFTRLFVLNLKMRIFNGQGDIRLYHRG